jgi:MbtH protein
MRPKLFFLFALLLSLGQALIAGEKPVEAGPEYRVVINHEEQYSIWVTDRDIPKGWNATGFVGSKEEALDYIEEVWTDMRPLSKRREAALKIYQKLQREK